jgi:hypothetical protein
MAKVLTRQEAIDLCDQFSAYMADTFGTIGTRVAIGNAEFEWRVEAGAEFPQKWGVKLIVRGGGVGRKTVRHFSFKLMVERVNTVVTSAEGSMRRKEADLFQTAGRDFISGWCAHRHGRKARLEYDTCGDVQVTVNIKNEDKPIYIGTVGYSEAYDDLVVKMVLGDIRFLTVTQAEAVLESVDLFDNRELE